MEQQTRIFTVVIVAIVAAISIFFIVKDQSSGPTNERLYGMGIEDGCNALETCGDGNDNNCDGSIDENCCNSMEKCINGKIAQLTQDCEWKSTGNQC